MPTALGSLHAAACGNVAGDPHRRAKHGHASRLRFSLCSFSLLQARTRVGLLVETAEAREVHHFCTLVGYGADAVCPWLAFDALAALRHDGKLAASETDEVLAAKYIKARAVSTPGLRCRLRSSCLYIVTTARSS